MIPVELEPSRQPLADATPRSRLARLLEAPAHRRCFAALVIAEAVATTAAIAKAQDVAAIAGAWTAGLAAWTLIEYVLHRVLFHLPRTHPLSVLGARQHLDHHDAPSRCPISKPLRLTMPAIAIAIAIAWVLGGLALAVCAGLIAGYLVYEVMHVGAHVLHDDHPWPAQRRRHLAHHGDPGRWFGITNPLWDRVFGTTSSGP